MTEKGRFNWKILGNVFYAVILIGALIFGSGMGWINTSPLLRTLFVQQIRNVPPEEAFHTNTFYLLVLGCDEDRDWITKKVTKKFARSDMMLLLRLDFERNLVTGLSIPRDVALTLQPYGTHKINAFHDLGGTDAAANATAMVLGVHPDRTVVLDYDAFQNIVNLVGGVEVYVERPLKYDDFAGDLHVDLSPGRHKLDGYQAMGYVRIRKVDNDFMRQKRQKDFLMSFKDSIEAHKEQIPNITNEVQHMFGEKLSVEELASLILFARSIGQDNVKLGMVPIIERPGTTNLDVDYEKLRPMLNEYLFTEGSNTVTYGTNRP